MHLFHVCCADCGIKLLEAAARELTGQKEEIHLYYFNPNIHPRSEYLTRLDAVKKVFPSHRLIIPAWRPRDYFQRVVPRWDGEIPSRATRCRACTGHRLEHTFMYAKEHGYTLVSSTLVTSVYQDQNAIRESTHALSQKYGIPFFSPALIRHGARTKGFYKQNYCGCSFSLLERMREKYALKSMSNETRPLR